MDATEVQMAYKIVLQEVIHSGFQKINFLWTVEQNNNCMNTTEM
jgi:hypothetical protein